MAKEESKRSDGYIDATIVKEHQIQIKHIRGACKLLGISFSLFVVRAVIHYFEEFKYEALLERFKKKKGINK